MKKTLVLIFLMMFSTLSFSQDESSQNLYFGKHEVKLNAIMMVVGAFEVNYEYLLNEESGIGMSVFLAYDEYVKDEVKYYISPYYRYYFGKKYAGGFFLEGFGMLNYSQRDLGAFLFDEEEDNFITDFALGIGLGGKWITKKGFTGEINYGIGRNIFKTDEAEYDFVGKFGITVGYRF